MEVAVPAAGRAPSAAAAGSWLGAPLPAARPAAGLPPGPLPAPVQCNSPGPLALNRCEAQSLPRPQGCGGAAGGGGGAAGAMRGRCGRGRCGRGGAAREPCGRSSPPQGALRGAGSGAGAGALRTRER